MGYTLQHNFIRAISSVVERFIDIEEAGSSILPSRTELRKGRVFWTRPYCFLATSFALDALPNQAGNLRQKMPHKLSNQNRKSERILVPETSIFFD
jgi:hypothetical protein